jgi:ParB-like chromosome segregation protein Spo0J
MVSIMTKASAVSATSVSQFTFRDPTSLHPHPLNKAVYGEEDVLDPEFLKSVQTYGILQPILVARLPLLDGGVLGNFVLSGHRRLQAAVQLGLKEVPVREQLVSDEDPLATLIAESQIIETNRQRIKTESQKDAEVMALLRIETQLAARRKVAGVAVDPEEAGKAVEKVAEKTGESADTVRKRAAIAKAKIPPAERNAETTNTTFNNLPKQTTCRAEGCGQVFPSKGAEKKHYNKEHVNDGKQTLTPAQVFLMASTGGASDGILVFGNSIKYTTVKVLASRLIMEDKAMFHAELSNLFIDGGWTEDTVKWSYSKPKPQAEEPITDTFYVIRFEDGLLFDGESGTSNVYEATDFNAPERPEGELPKNWSWAKVEATYVLTPVAPAQSVQSQKEAA